MLELFKISKFYFSIHYKKLLILVVWNGADMIAGNADPIHSRIDNSVFCKHLKQCCVG